MARLTIEIPADLADGDRVRSESEGIADERPMDLGVRERTDGGTADEPLIQRWARCWAGA